MNFTILRYGTIDSTNSEAIKQAKLGADEGVCIVADQQTAGRGRHGRKWSSEKGSGLYFSLILRPKVEANFLSLITLMTAVAVHDALEELYPIECDIKWVNDIHVSGKKICGILAETIETSQNLAVIVGIGINLTSANFPPEIADTATSIEAEIKRTPDTDELLQKLTSLLSYLVEMFYDANGAENIRREWTKRSSYAVGKNVRTVLENETVFGITCGIEKNGALRIETASGEIRVIHAGEVEQLRQTEQ